MNTDTAVTESSNEDHHRDEPIATTTAPEIIDQIDACSEVNEDSTNKIEHGNTTSSLLDRSYEILPDSKQVSNMEKNDDEMKQNKKKAQQQSGSTLPSSFANLISSVSFTSGLRSSFSNGLNNDRNDQTANKLIIETASIAASSISMTSETKEQIQAKKASLERKNLINLTKLIVKDLISSSLNAGRTIDDQHQCAIHLNNYFTLLDRVLKHGLKQNILTNKASSLWNALDSLPKYLTDKRLTSETVRSLAHTKTPDGKIKAWLRIAMMQKKLPEYFNELLANKTELLKDIYNEFAFMMNDEAQVFAGLIIGVNVIDCNFFVKDDNFDLMDDLIDLSPYLRAANSFDEDDHQHLAARGTMVDCESNQMEKVLDQKNYLEERSVHLEATITSLRDKIKQLEERNGRLEIDAKVNEVRIQKLQGADGKVDGDNLLSNFPIPDALKSLMNSSPDQKPKQSDLPISTPTSDSSHTSGQSNYSNTVPPDEEKTTPTNGGSHVESNGGDSKTISQQLSKENSDSDQHKKLLANLEEYKSLIGQNEKELTGLRERVGILETSYRGSLEKIRVLERDLEIQTSMNNERETTIKIYEKDLREKQGLVESLRTSLNEAKKMNSDLNERLTNTSDKLKDRLNTVTNLQASLDKWKLENKTMATRLNDKQAALKSVNAQLEQALKTIDDLKKYNEKINDELKKERECGQSCSNTVEAQTSKISELTERTEALEKELNEFRPYKEQMVDFKKRCQEYEQSLEEVGYQLRESRLEVEMLKENSSVFLDSQWMDSKQVKNCALCQQTFSVTRRKHHCRLCGNVFCQTCSDNKMELASSAKPARVCDTCHAFLLAKFVRSASSSASNSTASASIT